MARALRVDGHAVDAEVGEELEQQREARFRSVNSLFMKLKYLATVRAGTSQTFDLIMKKKFNLIDLVLMLPAVIALIYGIVSIT